MSQRNPSSSQELRLELERTVESWGIGQWWWRMGSDAIEQDADLRRLFEWPLEAEAMPFEHFMTIVHPHDRAIIQGGIDAARETGVYPDQLFRVVLPSRKTRWMLAKGQVMRDARGNIVQLYGTSIDVTQSKQNEAARERAQKLEAMGQLAAGVAHDFNNLLVAILGNVELAKQAQGPEELSELLEEAAHAATRARDLTQQLLAFGRRQPLKQRRVNVNRMLSDTLRMLRRLLPENIHIHADLSSDEPSVLGDAGQLEQVVVNLCVNARDAMPHGGNLRICCTCERRHSTIPGAAGTAFVHIAVADEGMGIPDDVLPRIFDPFFTTKSVGTGLGLSTAYGVIAQHGGTLMVRSGNGERGSVFTISLPAELGSQPAPSPTRPEPSPRGVGETILVAEDEAPVRNIVSRILKRAGYSVIEARDGCEAVELFRAHRATVALVLLDAVMPLKSGGDALAEIRSLAPGLPAILSSGYSDVLVSTRDLAPNAEFLSKPYEPDDLLRTVKNQLANSSRRSGLR